MSGKKRAWIIAVVIFLFAGPAAAYYTFREDPQIAKVKSLGRQLREKDALKGDERKQAWQELQQTVEAMGPEKRLQLEMQRRGGDEQGRGDERMDTFLALSPKERKTKLQEEIRAEEKRAKEREIERAKEAAEAQRAAAQSGAGGVGGTGGAGGQNAQAGQGGRGGGGGGPRGGWGKRDPQQDRLRLDYQTSASRAKRAEYSREKQITRVQMGLPADPPRGGRGGGRGR